MPEKKVLVSDFYCDAHPGESLDATQVHFGEIAVEGIRYNLVLCEKAKDELDQARRDHGLAIADAEQVFEQAKVNADATLAALVSRFAEEADEIVVVTAPTRRGKRDLRRQSPNEPTSVEVRKWAKANGIEVKDRGRVSKETVRTFKEATGWTPSLTGATARR